MVDPAVVPPVPDRRREIRRKFDRLWHKWDRLSMVVGLIFLVGSVWALGYRGRVELRDSQVSACKRGNLLRAETNRRAGLHELDTQVLREFMGDAIKARLASGDVAIARRYERRLKRLDGLHFAQVELVDCERAIARVKFL